MWLKWAYGTLSLESKGAFLKIIFKHTYKRDQVICCGALESTCISMRRAMWGLAIAKKKKINIKWLAVWLINKENKLMSY